VQRLLTALLFVLLGLVGAPTTTASAAAYTYDVPTITRVGVPAIGAAEASPPQRSVVREGFAAPTSEASGSSTPPNRSVVATESAGALDSSVVYRYVSDGEATAARNLGRVPNTDVLGQPRSVFYSPDYIDSVAEAENSLQIGSMNPGGATASPGYRITASPQGAQWTYGGNVAGGSGIEMLTDQSLKILRIDHLPR